MTDTSEHQTTLRDDCQQSIPAWADAPLLPLSRRFTDANVTASHGTQISRFAAASIGHVRSPQTALSDPVQTEKIPRNPLIDSKLRGAAIQGFSLRPANVPIRRREQTCRPNPPKYPTQGRNRV